MSFDSVYGSYKDRFEVAFRERADKMNYKPQILSDSMRYSMLIGGKRIRPVIMMHIADLLSCDLNDIIPYAVALEMIHTYSLIHDDLPSMDNDDFRRGKPSNHKVFGEANGILAGDALLNEGLNLLLKQCHKGQNYISASEYICASAGAAGMIAGQSADLNCSEGDGAEGLFFIYAHKTGKLLASAAMTAPIITGRFIKEFKELGENLGVLFQLTDDILDVTGSFEAMGKTIGKDESENKLTCVKLFGLEKSKAMAEEYSLKCFKALDSIPLNTDFLKELVRFVLIRTN